MAAHRLCFQLPACIATARIAALAALALAAGCGEPTAAPTLPTAEPIGQSLAAPPEAGSVDAADRSIGKATEKAAEPDFYSPSATPKAGAVATTELDNSEAAAPPAADARAVDDCLGTVPLDAPAKQRPADAAFDLQLRRLAAAMENYRQAFDVYPADHAPRMGVRAHPGLSWRVAILPYLGTDGYALWQRFRFDQPWDSPHNKALLDEMPDAFAIPGLGIDGQPLPPGRTVLHQFVGKNLPLTASDRNKGTKREFLGDGAEHTAALVVGGVESAVEWTRPSSLDWGEVGADETLAALGTPPIADEAGPQWPIVPFAGDPLLLPAAGAGLSTTDARDLLGQWLRHTDQITPAKWREQNGLADLMPAVTLASLREDAAACRTERLRRELDALPTHDFNPEALRGSAVLVSRIEELARTSGADFKPFFSPYSDGIRSPRMCILERYPGYLSTTPNQEAALAEGKTLVDRRASNRILYAFLTDPNATGLGDANLLQKAAIEHLQTQSSPVDQEILHHTLCSEWRLHLAGVVSLRGRTSRAFGHDQNQWLDAMVDRVLPEAEREQVRLIEAHYFGPVRLGQPAAARPNPAAFRPKCLP